MTSVASPKRSFSEARFHNTQLGHHDLETSRYRTSRYLDCSPAGHDWQRHDLPEVPHSKLRIEFCGFRHQVPLDDPADKPTTLPNRPSRRLQHSQPTTKKAIRVRPYLTLIRGFQNDACTNLRSTPEGIHPAISDNPSARSHVLTEEVNEKQVLVHDLVHNSRQEFASQARRAVMQAMTMYDIDAAITNPIILASSDRIREACLQSQRHLPRTLDNNQSPRNPRLANEMPSEDGNSKYRAIP